VVKRKVNWGGGKKLRAVPKRGSEKPAQERTGGGAIRKGSSKGRRGQKMGRCSDEKQDGLLQKGGRLSDKTGNKKKESVSATFKRG